MELVAVQPQKKSIENNNGYSSMHTSEPLTESEEMNFVIKQIKKIASFSFIRKQVINKDGKYKISTLYLFNKIPIYQSVSIMQDL
jgi:hypothetical protein